MCTGRSISNGRSSTCSSRAAGCWGGPAVVSPSIEDAEGHPSEAVTDAAAVYPAVLDEFMPSAWHRIEQYVNNPIEADHSRLKHRLRAMRGLCTDRTAQVVIAGHAFIQNLRHGHYELGLDVPPRIRAARAFNELAWQSDHGAEPGASTDQITQL
jgi:hypothetical protein